MEKLQLMFKGSAQEPGQELSRKRKESQKKVCVRPMAQDSGQIKGILTIQPNNSPSTAASQDYAMIRTLNGQTYKVPASALQGKKIGEKVTLKMGDPTSSLFTNISTATVVSICTGLTTTPSTATTTTIYSVQQPALSITTPPPITARPVTYSSAVNTQSKLATSISASSLAQQQKISLGSHKCASPEIEFIKQVTFAPATSRQPKATSPAVTTAAPTVPTTGCVTSSDFGAEMLLFQMTLNERDSVIGLFNKLNALIIENDPSQNEIDDCDRTISKLINMLENLKLAGASSSERHPEDDLGERSAKKAKKARDEIVFNINLDALLNTTRQVSKNQKAVIAYSKSVAQAYKLRLIRENTSTIEQLQGLKLAGEEDELVGNKVAVDSRSTGERPASNVQLEEVSLQNHSDPKSDASDRTANSIGSSSNVQSYGVSNAIFDYSNSLLAISSGTAATPAACNAPNPSPKTEATIDYFLEGVQRFFDKNQKRRTDVFSLSDGSSSLGFVFKIGVGKPRNQKKYLTISACSCTCIFCNAQNREAYVLVGASLLSQRSGVKKLRKSYFKFDRNNREAQFPFFISHVDLLNSVFLQNDRLCLRFSCKSLGQRIQAVDKPDHTEPKLTRSRSALLSSL